MWCTTLTRIDSTYSVTIYGQKRTVQSFIKDYYYYYLLFRSIITLVISKHKVKVAIEVEVDPKVPFSIATTPMRTGGRYYFPGIAPLYPWYVPYIAEC